MILQNKKNFIIFQILLTSFLLFFPFFISYADHDLHETINQKIYNYILDLSVLKNSPKNKISEIFNKADKFSKFKNTNLKQELSSIICVADSTQAIKIVSLLSNIKKSAGIISSSHTSVLKKIKFNCSGLMANISIPDTIQQKLKIGIPKTLFNTAEFINSSNIEVHGSADIKNISTNSSIAMTVQTDSLKKITRILFIHPIIINNVSLSKNGFSTSVKSQIIMPLIPYLKFSDKNIKQELTAIIDQYKELSTKEPETWQEISSYSRDMKKVDLKSHLLIKSLYTNPSEKDFEIAKTLVQNESTENNYEIIGLKKAIDKIENPGLISVSNSIKKSDSDTSFQTATDDQSIIDNSKVSNIINTDNIKSDLQEQTPQSAGSTSLQLNMETNILFNGSGIRNGAIKGKILNSDNSSISSSFRVEARMDAMARVSYSDNNGAYTIPDLPLGQWDVLFSAPGFAPAFTGESFLKEAYIENGSTYIMPTLHVKSIQTQIPGKITGKVINITTGDLMEGVAIACSKNYVLSNSEGEWSINNLTPGETDIKALASGYKEYDSKTIIVPNETVSHQILMESSGADAAGIIKSDDYYWLMDWNQVVVSVKSYSYESVTIKDGGAFSLKVPALLPEYTIEARAPYCHTSTVSIPGPLYPGGTLYVDGLQLERKIKNCTLKIIAQSNCSGSVYIYATGGMQFGPITFSNSNQSTIKADLPMGDLEFYTMGAITLSPAQKDAQKMNITVGPQTENIILILLSN